jgi:transposase
MRYAFTDAEWLLIAPILPCKPRGVPRVDDRRVLNGIFWVLRSGAPWRDLPKCYGPYTTCYNRFVRWRCAGVWDRILTAISHRDDAEVQMIDSTIVRAHQHATCIQNGAGEDFGRSRGGLTTKIHAVVDANGLPLHVSITGGQQHDSLVALALLEGLPGGGMVLADKAYDATEIQTFVSSLEAGRTSRPVGTGVIQSASARTSIATEIRSNGSSTGSSTVGASRRAMRNTPLTSLLSLSSQPSGSGFGFMSPRPSIIFSYASLCYYPAHEFAFRRSEPPCRAGCPAR